MSVLLLLYISLLGFMVVAAVLKRVGAGVRRKRGRRVRKRENQSLFFSFQCFQLRSGFGSRCCIGKTSMKSF